MRRSFVLFSILFLCAACTLPAQNLSGYWEGKIGITKTDSLTIGLQIDYQGDTLYAELDSPDQYFTGQPVSGLTFADSAIAFRVPDFGLNYEGTLSADGQRFTGTCTQYGRKFDCTLSQGATRKLFPRPQTPTPPYPYRTEEVNFRDRSGKKPLINGTLTLPQGQPKGLIIFISGSGWQDRDESLFAHKPFAVIADTLTKAGFATYRYDDFPAAIFRKSTTYDFADGVRLILDSLLQRVELQGLEVGLLGHSEGSLVASMVAADDKRIAFTIHLGGVAQPIDEILLYQSEAIARASGELTEKEIANGNAINKRIYSILKKCKSKEECAEKIGKVWDELAAKLTDEEKVKYNLTPQNKLTALQTFSSPWYYELFRIDPKKYLKKIKTPVFAISGQKDMQVDANATEKIMDKYLTGKTLYYFYKMPGLNHLLQPCTTGSPDEYPLIETTIAPEVLDIIVSWCRKIAL
jgi:pimeloyl-ACP methyl ester carboxylesterase